MSYLCAGLYAEGRTDYWLLLPLLDRLLPELSEAIVNAAREAPPA